MNDQGQLLQAKQKAYGSGSALFWFVFACVLVFCSARSMEAWRQAGFFASDEAHLWLIRNQSWIRSSCAQAPAKCFVIGRMVPDWERLRFWICFLVLHLCVFVVLVPGLFHVPREGVCSFISGHPAMEPPRNFSRCSLVLHLFWSVFCSPLFVQPTKGFLCLECLPVSVLRS